MGTRRTARARRPAARHGADAPDVSAGPVGWRDEGLQGLTEVVATVLVAPMAAIALDGQDGQPFRGGVGFPASWIGDPGTPLARLCRHVVLSGRPFVVPDMRGPSTPSGDAVGEIVAYLGAPLLASDGQAVGALCVFDRRPRSWRPVQVGLVANIAAAAARLVELRGLHDAAVRRRTDDSVAIPVVGDLRWPLEVARDRLRLLRERLAGAAAVEAVDVLASLREIEVGTDWLAAQVRALLAEADRAAAAETPPPIRHDPERRAASRPIVDRWFAPPD